MDQLVENAEMKNAAEKHGSDVAVAVITTAGIYPSEDEFRRVDGDTEIEDVLKRRPRSCTSPTPTTGLPALTTMKST